MVVKIKQVFKHLNDLGSIFLILRKYKLRLNASKCSFGVSSRKFLGYMITYWGIKVNPGKIRAINDLHPPQNPKKVQRLTKLIVAPNRFISSSADHCWPFFQLLHKWKDFLWTEECNIALEELKKYLAHPLVLSRPEKEEVLYAYIVVTNHAVSLVLVWTGSGVQKLMYYVSKSLQEAETRYLPLKKAILAIIHATRKFPL